MQAGWYLIAGLLAASCLGGFVIRRA